MVPLERPPIASGGQQRDPSRLRRAVLVVAGVNFGIIGLAVHAAFEVWKVSEEERLAANALAGEVD